MIPVVTMNKDGDMSYQIFNDNLAPVEQINRKLLSTIAYAQTKLVNDRDAFSQKMGKVEYTDAQIEEINVATDALVKAVKEAIDAFADVVNK